ncbi:ankyrin repeat-containing domain protein [Ilyonectria destructans]|nr:ankyrin repeat-containing domain protein [Ilyonectria destructans]
MWSTWIYSVVGSSLGANFIKDARGKTPLIWAAQRGHYESVQVLLAHEGVDPNIRDQVGRTALSWAAGKGHDNVLELLLAVEGIRKDSEDCNGYTPIMWAARKSKRNALRLLCHHGALVTEPLRDGLIFQLAMFMPDVEIYELPMLDSVGLDGLFGFENLFQGQCTLRA